MGRRPSLDHIDTAQPARSDTVGAPILPGAGKRFGRGRPRAHRDGRPMAMRSPGRRCYGRHAGAGERLSIPPGETDAPSDRGKKKRKRKSQSARQAEKKAMFLQGLWSTLALAVVSTDALLPPHRLRGAGRRRSPGIIPGPAFLSVGLRKPYSDHVRREPPTGTRLSASSSARTSPSSTWNSLTVSELKAELRRRNLPVSGVKAKLILRLEQHDRHARAESATMTTTASRNNGRRRMEDAMERAFPPRRGKATEKEVLETLQWLEGFKVGDKPSSRKRSTQKQHKNASRKYLERPSKQLGKQQPVEEAPPPSSSDIATTQSGLPSPLTLDVTEQSTPAEKLELCMSQLRLKSANDLRAELASLRLVSKGRKPDLVARLAEHYVARDAAERGGGEDEAEAPLPTSVDPPPPPKGRALLSFAGMPRLSTTAATALHRAFGGGGGEESSSDRPLTPTPIQSVAIPKLFNPPNPSALLHAPTGSGKSIAFLLPITETLWKEVDARNSHGRGDPNDMENGMALVLLPTRELAAQVAGVASVLAPPGMVRLVPRPMDLRACWKDDENIAHGAREDSAAYGGGAEANKKNRPRVLVGSAKAIFTSLFGDKNTPGTPTPKPQGKALLRSTRWLVLDEVDRLLHVKRSRTDKATKRHEKPAAVIAATIARLTTGRCQVIAASATVGRPLRRELSRVLGLHSSECPETLRGEEDEARAGLQRGSEGDGDADAHVGRAVRIPVEVANYVLPVDGSTSGSLLTSAAFACKALLQNKHDFQASNRRLLLVLTRNCGIKIHNALGALRHFGIHPPPQSLLDVLEASGIDRLVEVHREVSGVEGVGGAKRRTGQQRQQTNEGSGANSNEEEGYLLVTHEDNIRGLHLDALDAVVVVGRPGGPDEYTHIAGRTGRAGKKGSVVNVVGYEQAAALASWEKMLGVDFLPVDEGSVAGLID